MHLEWRSMLEVGVAEMDDDHRRLIELLNRAQDASADDDQRASLSVLHELQDFVAWHFAREELLMARLRYGGSGAHRNEHGQLLEGMRWQIR